MLIGIFMSFCTCSIAFVASPSEALGARLKEIVTTGNCPWWLTDNGAVRDSQCVKALSGTAAPLSAGTANGLAEPVVAFELVPVGPVVFEVADEPAVVTTPLGLTLEEEFDGVAVAPAGAEEPDGDCVVAADRT